MVTLTRKQKAHVIVHNAAIAAAGVGAGWVSDLVFVPDALPLFLLQALMLAGLALIFRLRPVTAVLLALSGAFTATLLYWALALWLGGVLGDSILFGCVVLGAGITEVLGGVAYHIFWGMRRRDPKDHPLLAGVIRATGTEPILGLVSSVPMLLAMVAVFSVVDLERTAEVRLQEPGGTVLLRIDHPLLDRRGGMLHVSGRPAGTPDRVEIEVDNRSLAVELNRLVLDRRVPRVMVRALLKAAPSPGQVIHATADWVSGVATGSDYWHKVRSRLYLLLLGLLGSLAMVWLGHHRRPSPEG